MSEPMRTHNTERSDGALSVLDPLQTARALAMGQQAAAGRSPEGRGWAVVVTHIETALALVEYYDPGQEVGNPARSKK